MYAAVFFDTTLLSGIPGVEQNKPRFTLKVKYYKL